MDYEFKLPDIGEGLVEGEIVRWFVKPGDQVQENAPLAAVLTDKAEVEVPSPKSGKIVKLFGKPGEKVKVHAPLAIIAVAAPSGVVAGSATAAGAKAPASQKPSKNGGSFVFNLPDIGEGLVEGELVKWLVKEGEKVAENQALATVLTDKAEVEVPSPKTGVVAKLHAKPGQKVKVHAPLVTFSGVDGAAPAAPSGVAAGSTTAAGADSPTLRRPAPANQRSGREVLATPRVRQMAKQMGLDLSLLSGTGPEGRVLEKDLQSAPSASGAAANATPAVKALAASLGVDLSRVKGTGPGGRVVEGDVRALAPKAAPPKPGARIPAGPIALTPASAPETGEERRPFAGIRRKIAEKMVQSKRAVADVTHVDECDMTALLALREEMKPLAAAKGVKLTFLPFVMKALVKTLRQYPLFNASIDDAAGEIVVKKAVNLGIAVAAPQGLIVPVIKGADGRDLLGLGAEVNALAEKVRANKIDAASLQGGTFTITNIGPIGGLYANPIVNHPEVAILALMKLRKAPVVRDGGLFVRDMMNLCLTFDHRLIDGSDAARFMNTLISHLENPRTLL